MTLKSVWTAAKPVLFHALVVFMAAAAAVLAPALNGQEKSGTSVAFVVAAIVAGLVALVNYLVGLLPLKLGESGGPFIGTIESMGLHAVVIFLTAWGAYLASASMHATSFSALGAAAWAATVTAAVSVTTYLSGLIPPSAPVQAEARLRAGFYRPAVPIQYRVDTGTITGSSGYVVQVGTNQPQPPVEPEGPAEPAQQ